MIRIDEIYNHTFWPFIKNNIPNTCMWFCEPPFDLEPLKNHTVPGLGISYVFLFDQEPLDFQRLQPMLQEIHANHSRHDYSPGRGAIITSELHSSTVEQICQLYDWYSFYYFYNGWAALDWFRGYDKTFLITPPEDRRVKHTFISPNRIIAGERPHRLILLYHLFSKSLGQNLISCPLTCPAEGISVYDAVKKFEPQYPDIVNTFVNAGLPRTFDEGAVSSNASAKLDLFDESSKCLLYLVTETVGTGYRLHLTEKTFKPICMKMPFVIAGTQGSLSYLRGYGFRTFHDIWDESYDDEPDDFKRMEKIADLLRSLEDLGDRREEVAQQCREIVEYNFNHFYGGGFEALLWQEFKSMLDDIKIKLSV